VSSLFDHEDPRDLADALDMNDDGNGAKISVSEVDRVDSH
jgi:hypothetical protein